MPPSLVLEAFRNNVLQYILAVVLEVEEMRSKFASSLLL